MDNYRYLLHTICLTYNHESFIEDALNGFVMQQTSFPFVCTIVDDASTDGEQEVIKNYLQENFDLQDSSIAYDKDVDYGHVTFARHKTNENCFFAVILLKENHYSQKKSKAPYLTEWTDTKYLALCEGDDYWTDPLKLQKQVDIMDLHPEVSMCYTDYNTVDGEGNTIEWPNHKSHTSLSFSGDNLRNLFKGNYIMTATTMFRTKMITPPLLNTKFDYGCFLNASFRGNLYYIKEKTSSYRLNPHSLIHTQYSVVNQGLDDTWYAYVDFYLSNKNYHRSWYTHIMILSDIDAKLISKMRGVGAERAKRFLCAHKVLWSVFVVGVFIRIKNRIRKR